MYMYFHQVSGGGHWTHTPFGSPFKALPLSYPQVLKQTSFYWTNIYQLLISRHFLTHIVLYVHLRHVSSGGHGTQCLTTLSPTPCCWAIRKCSNILSFSFFYYRSICIIDNGASRRRTRNVRFRDGRADHLTTSMCSNKLFFFFLLRRQN